MGLARFLYNWLHRRVLKHASGNRAFDIIEVRTKELTLTYVNTETDIRIRNDFFLPVTILSIETDIFNPGGVRVGKMTYREPKRLKGHSSAVFTTRSRLSNITAFFHALQHLLAMPVKMRSVGTARIKLLWWTFEVPVDDTFELRSNQVKLTEPVSEEEKQRRAAKREERRKASARKQESAEPETAAVEDNTLSITIAPEAEAALPEKLPGTPDAEPEPNPGIPVEEPNSNA